MYSISNSGNVHHFEAGRERLVLHTPSRNAIFARLNVILPEWLKRGLLFTIFRNKDPEHSGFRAYYDHCTPRDFRCMVERNGLDVEELRVCFWSSYFTFFLPLYVAWRLWILLFHRLAGEQAAEMFTIVCRKHDHAGHGSNEAEPLTAAWPRR